jgi:hypothetical protein
LTHDVAGLTNLPKQDLICCSSSPDTGHLAGESLHFVDVLEHKLLVVLINLIILLITIISSSRNPGVSAAPNYSIAVA